MRIYELVAKRPGERRSLCCPQKHSVCPAPSHLLRFAVCLSTRFFVLFVLSVGDQLRTHTLGCPVVTCSPSLAPFFAAFRPGGVAHPCARSLTHQSPFTGTPCALPRPALVRRPRLPLHAVWRVPGVLFFRVFSRQKTRCRRMMAPNAVRNRKPEQQIGGVISSGFANILFNLIIVRILIRGSRYRRSLSHGRGRTDSD